jgi:hypothetical protein
MSKLQLISDLIQENVNVELLRNVYKKINFPMNQLESLKEEPIINSETYAILLNIFQSLDINGKILEYVNQVFLGCSNEICDIIHQFIYMTFYGHCRYMLSQERFYDTEESLEADILEHTKELYKCVQDELSHSEKPINEQDK